MKKPTTICILLSALIAMSAVTGCGKKSASANDDAVSIALVVKNIGNPFFDAVNKGWQEACDELGVTSIYRGPEQPTPEGQIEIIESLLAQRVAGITYVANDPQSLLNVSEKAMKRNVAVVGWESGVVPGSRHVSTEPVSAARIGSDQVKMMAELIGHKGQIAILSAAATMDNQNTWIAYMKEELKKPEYAGMELVAVVYGDDVREKSYNEALGLFKAYPELRGIISPTSVGLAATAKAVTDQGKINQVEVTGLGLPSELAEYVENDACKVLGLWNPIDLGYLNAYVTYRLTQKEITGAPGETFTAGRLGGLTIEKQEGADYGLIYLGSLFRFDKNNINEYKEIF